MSWQRSVQAAVRALRSREASLKKELDRVRAKIKELQEVARSEGSGTRSKSRAQRLSPKGRAAISRAAKKRWAEYRRQKKAR